MKAEEYELMYRVEDHHWWYAGMRAISAAMLADVGTPARILDAGCGTGRNALELEKLGCTVAVDVSAVPLRLAARRGLTRLAQASIDALPFADGTFDVVTAFDVLCHGAVVDERAALRELRRVLRPGGNLLLHVPAYPWLRSRHDRAVDNVRRYSAGGVRALLTDAGLTTRRLTFANTVLFPLAAAKRLADRARGAGEHASDLATAFGVAGSLFRAVLGFEARVLRHVDLPFGLTLVALARRDDADSGR
jgi:SAM-dependent methyltransferase